MVRRIEPDKGDEGADVGLRHVRAKEEGPAVTHPCLKLVEHREDTAAGVLVGHLGRREARPVDAVVQQRIHPVVQVVDRGGQSRRIKVRARGQRPEARVQHPQDVGGFVVHDGAAGPVPEHRNRGPAGEQRRGPGVDLVHPRGPVDAVGRRSRIAAEPPAFGPELRLDDRNRDRALKPLDLPRDQRARRPGTDQRHVEVVASGLGREPARARRPGASVRRHPVPERGDLPDEPALRVRRLNGLPVARPFPVNEQPASPSASA